MFRGILSGSKLSVKFYRMTSINGNKSKQQKCYKFSELRAKRHRLKEKTFTVHSDFSQVVLPNVGKYLSRHMTKPTNWLCAQRRLRAAWESAQSDQSSLCTQWVGKDPSFLHADSEDSDQTGQMSRLIWVFAGHTCHFVGFVMRQLIINADRIFKIQLLCNIINWFWFSLYFQPVPIRLTHWHQKAD